MALARREFPQRFLGLLFFAFSSTFGAEIFSSLGGAALISSFSFASRFQSALHSTASQHPLLVSYLAPSLSITAQRSKLICGSVAV